MGFRTRAVYSCALAICLSACLGTNRNNHLLSGRNTLSVVQGPDEEILVQTRGGSLYNVNLSDASMTFVDPPASAASDDILVRIYYEAPLYVVKSEAGVHQVEGVPKGDPILSPDSSKFFVLPKVPLLDIDGQVLWVVMVSDGSFQQFKIGTHDPFVQWSKDSEAILYKHGEFVEQSIDAATGVVSDAPPSPARFHTGLSRDVPGPIIEKGDPLACESQGYYLEQKDDDGKVKIVLVPSGSKLASTQLIFGKRPRVLVAATSYPYSMRSKGNPDTLVSYGFTESCTHHLFGFGEKIYVGSLATGAFAYLTSGKLYH